MGGSSGLLEPVMVNDIVRYARRPDADRASRCDVDAKLEAAIPIRVRSARSLSALLNLIGHAIDAMPDGGSGWQPGRPIRKSG